MSLVHQKEYKKVVYIKDTPKKIISLSTHMPKRGIYLVLAAIDVLHGLLKKVMYIYV